jgi:hypothetical protein
MPGAMLFQEGLEVLRAHRWRQAVQLEHMAAAKGECLLIFLLTWP